ncbi:DUF6088 family protein [Arcicella sp. LKC2W]|uniref:DUF6088 family protein n=1 Tax=Arcicella sp. LKC2W TaxID=2984198 RepID=UPI002B218C44|nr:DUF6088 family protein [Arcicella sp. LKC2W]MEA5460323.1 DUF6088 family protein [Arcicella sp. LKC2W]
MTVANQISSTINLFPEGMTFGYEQLNIEKDKFMTAAKALERLQKKGLIKKIAKGVFYKPQMTIFGELKPSEEEVLKSYLFQNGKRIAYITGSYLYNKLGLTTQLTRIIRIACFSKRIYIKRGTVIAKPVKSYAMVTNENYEILGILDAMKDLKDIPDADINSAISVFENIIKAIEEKSRLPEFIEYALLYPPRVRALLGAILENQGNDENIKILKASLNPLTVIKIGIEKAYLPTVSNWNIQ